MAKRFHILNGSTGRTRHRIAWRIEKSEPISAMVLGAVVFVRHTLDQFLGEKMLPALSPVLAGAHTREIERVKNRFRSVASFFEAWVGQPKSDTTASLKPAPHAKA